MISTRSIPVGSGLAHAVEGFTLYAGTGHRREYERVYPSGQAEITLNLADGQLRCYDATTFESHRARGLLLSGPRLSPYIVDTAQLGDLLSLRLQPAGIWRLFGIPAAEFAGRHVTLTDALGSGWEETFARIHETRDPRGRVRLLESELLRWRGRPSHPVVADAISRIRRLSGQLRVMDVAKDHGMSFRRFNVLFQREVGISPKQFARLRRFQAALAAVPTGGTGSAWAMEAGYADQAHSIREFKEFTGLTPAQYHTLRVGIT